MNMTTRWQEKHTTIVVFFSPQYPDSAGNNDINFVYVSSILQRDFRHMHPGQVQGLAEPSIYPASFGALQRLAGLAGGRRHCSGAACLYPSLS
jgi:hypothetical protein